MSEIKTIGVLTSGGDAPGMNAVIRAVVRTAHGCGLGVKGIKRGYAGLLEKDVIDMPPRSVSGMFGRGGTVLHTARSAAFREDAGREQARQNCLELGIDGLIVCGGDGTFMGAMALTQKGIPCIGIPCTIDNDIPCTEYTIGFDTACNTVVDIVDKLRDTSQSHNRCTIVEVMGNSCGDIALHAGICCGAEAVIIPEIRHDLERDVLNEMREAANKGKIHFIVIVSEGVTGERAKRRTMDAHQLAGYIQEKTGIETRATIIGHIQRGGTPSAKDRLMGSMMGNFAVKLLRSGVSGRVVTLKNNKLVDYDRMEALEMNKTIDFDALRTLKEIR
jgi:6-phosphofructokinase 1